VQDLPFSAGWANVKLKIDFAIPRVSKQTLG